MKRIIMIFKTENKQTNSSLSSQRLNKMIHTHRKKCLFILIFITFFILPLNPLLYSEAKAATPCNTIIRKSVPDNISSSFKPRLVFKTGVITYLHSTFKILLYKNYSKICLGIHMYIYMCLYLL